MLLGFTLQTYPLAAVTADEINEVLHDPTRPNWFGLKKKKPKANHLVLNSLVMSPQRRIAVINGELMREGETKHNITVQQILDDRVLVTTKSGNKRVLKLQNARTQARNQKKRLPELKASQATRLRTTSEEGITQ